VATSTCHSSFPAGLTFLANILASSGNSNSFEHINSQPWSPLLNQLISFIVRTYKKAKNPANIFKANSFG